MTGFLDPKPLTVAAGNATYVPQWKPATAYAAGQAVVNPSGDVVTSKAAHTSGSSFTAANWNYSPTYIPFVDPAPGAMGIRKKVSTTHGTGWVFGTASSFGFSGTGTPAEIAGAFGIYQEYGKSAPGAPVLKTTQGGYAVTNYWGPTADDSAEGFSSAVILKAVAGGITQTKDLTGMEGISQVEDGNNVTGGGRVISFGARQNVLGTGHADEVRAYHMSFNTSGGPPYGTVDKYYGLKQDTSALTRGAAQAWGVYVIDQINTETGLSLARSDGAIFRAAFGGAGDASSSAVLIGPHPTTVVATFSGSATITTTPQDIPVQAGAALSSSGGQFLLDNTARTLISYTGYNGTNALGVTVASGSIAVSAGQVGIRTDSANTTALRIVGQRGQNKNILEIWDGIGSGTLRIRATTAGLWTNGVDFFAADGSANIKARISGATGFVQPGTSTGPGTHIYSGSGAPNISGSVAGDIYVRTDTPTTSLQRIYVASATNTWTGIL